MKRKILLILFFIFSIALYAQKTPFKFAWLSDTHVGGATGAEDLGIIVKDINSQNDISFVIISGDITESGRTKDLILAKKILDSLNKKYYIIPGNHDTKWSESGAFRFKDIFKDEKFIFEFRGFIFLGLHEGPIMKMGDGHFSPEDLRWLKKTFSKIKPKDKPIFIITHYPIDESIDNWFEFLNIVKFYNIQLILVGHGHVDHVMNFNSIPGIMGRSILRTGKVLSGYNMAEISSDSIYFTKKDIEKLEKLPWAKFAIKNNDFSKIKINIPNFQINEIYPQVKSRIIYNSGYTIASAPAYSDEKIFIGDQSGIFKCISIKDSKTIWSFRTKKGIYSSPEISGDRIVFGSCDENIYCLNILDGKLVWKLKTNGAVLCSPIIKDGIVYIGSSDSIFRAINLRNGKLIWKFDSLKGFVESKPLLYDGKVIFGAWDTFLYALNQKNGKMEWRWSSDRKGNLLSPAACIPVASDNKIFVVAPDRYLTAIDSKTGKTVWRTNRWKVRESIGISEKGDKIYLKTMNDTVLAISTKGSNSEVVWVSDCKYGYDIDPGILVEKEGKVFFGTKNGLVYSLDGSNGKILWINKVDYSIINDPRPLQKDKLIVSSLDGKVFLIEKKEK